MAASRFTAELREELLARFAAGCSVADAARASNLREKTLKSWLTRGRRETGTEHAAFVEQVDLARAQAKAATGSGSMDLPELRRAVAKAARAGSVAAMKLMWDILSREPRTDPDVSGDPLTDLDELAARRAGRQDTGSER
jgi:hypothetical protein